MGTGETATAVKLSEQAAVAEVAEQDWGRKGRRSSPQAR